MDNKYFEDDIYYENDNEGEEFNFDIKKYLQVLIKRKWLILAIALIVTLPWLYHLKNKPPIYEASCRIRFRNLTAGSENTIDLGRIIELTSRTFAEKVVAQLGLTLQMINVDNEEPIKREQLFAEFITTTSPVRGQYLFRWHKQDTYSIYRLVETQEKLVDEGYIKDTISSLHETQNGFSFRLAPDISSLPNEIKFRINKLRNTVKSFQANIQVRRTGGGGILFLTMTDRDPWIVAEKVNRLAELYINESKFLKKSTFENH